MILILGGTLEAREVAARLQAAGENVMVSVATQYGREFLAPGPNILVKAEPLDAAGLKTLVHQFDINLVLDCTHPFAAQISRNAIKVCHQTSTRYIRLERENIKADDYTGLVRVPNFKEASRITAEIAGNIMLTIGVNHLHEFTNSKNNTGQRLIARVLPHAYSITRCLKAGLAPRDIIAIQGPFSVAFNKAMFIEYDIAAIVAKDSGEIGGTGAKLEAAKQAGIQFILVERPQLDYPEMVHTVEDLVSAAGGGT